jgi:hypothetical protein
MPGDFDRRFVGEQLRGLGLSRAAAARRLGLPHAHMQPAFYELYRRLLPILRPLQPPRRHPTAAEQRRWQAKAAEACRCLLTVLKLPPESWAIGAERVHLSTAAQRKLHARQRHLAVVLARRALRHATWPAVRHRLAGDRRRQAATEIQRSWRGLRTWQRYAEARWALLLIQRHLRRHWARRAGAMLGGWEAPMVGPGAPLAMRLAACRSKPSRLLPPHHELEADATRLAALARRGAADDRGLVGLPAGGAHLNWATHTATLHALCCTQSLQATKQLFEAVEKAKHPSGVFWLPEQQLRQLNEFVLREADIWSPP